MMQGRTDWYTRLPKLWKNLKRSKGEEEMFQPAVFCINSELSLLSFLRLLEGRTMTSFPNVSNVYNVLNDRSASGIGSTTSDGPNFVYASGALKYVPCLTIIRTFSRWCYGLAINNRHHFSTYTWKDKPDEIAQTAMSFPLSCDGVVPLFAWGDHKHMLLLNGSHSTWSVHLIICHNRQNGDLR